MPPLVVSAGPESLVIDVQPSHLEGQKIETQDARSDYLQSQTPSSSGVEERISCLWGDTFPPERTQNQPISGLLQSDLDVILEAFHSTKKQGGGYVGELSPRAKTSEIVENRDIAPAVQKLFNQIDSDHDGRLSKQELADAIQSGRYTDKDAQIIGALYRSFNSICQTENDNSAWSGGWARIRDHTISLEDLITLAYTAERASGYRSTDGAPPPDYAQAHFAKFDHDGDGQISREDLETTIKREPEGSTAWKVAQHLLANFSDYCVDIEPLPTGNSLIRHIPKFMITPTSLDRAVEVENFEANKSRDGKQWANYLEKNWASLDPDGNGLITESELRDHLRKLVSENAPEADRITVFQLIVCFPHLPLTTKWSSSLDSREVAPAGISVRTIEALRNQPQFPFLDVENPSAILERMKEQAKKIRDRAQQAGVNTEDLYTGQDPLAAIQPDAVLQGYIGDCYLLATIASLAKTDPQLIQEMIKDNGDGTYTVTFPGDPAHPITVKRPSESEIGMYNGASKYGIWLNVLEKAYGQYRIETKTNIGDATLPQEGADHGFPPHKVISLLTGLKSDRSNVEDLSPSQLNDLIHQSLNGNSPQPIVAVTPHENTDGEIYTRDGFRKNHAYAIVGFDPNGPDGGWVEILNPWNDGVDSPRGYIRMSMKQFRENFGYVSHTDPGEQRGN